jgi:hypothetical protein
LYNQAKQLRGQIDWQRTMQKYGGKKSPRLQTDPVKLLVLRYHPAMTTKDYSNNAMATNLL